jgi:hypothetical protein
MIVAFLPLPLFLVQPAVLERGMAERGKERNDRRRSAASALPAFSVQTFVPRSNFRLIDVPCSPMV